MANKSKIIELFNGTKFWCKNGLLHREDGPAVEWSNGNKEWYLNNRHFSPYNNQKIKQLKKVGKYYIVFYHKFTFLYKIRSTKPIVINSKLKYNLTEKQLKLYMVFI